MPGGSAGIGRASSRGNMPAGARCARVGPSQEAWGEAAAAHTAVTDQMAAAKASAEAIYAKQKADAGRATQPHAGADAALGFACKIAGPIDDARRGPPLPHAPGQGSETAADFFASFTAVHAKIISDEIYKGTEPAVISWMRADF